MLWSIDHHLGAEGVSIEPLLVKTHDRDRHSGDCILKPATLINPFHAMVAFSGLKYQKTHGSHTYSDIGVMIENAICNNTMVGLLHFDLSTQ